MKARWKHEVSSSNLSLYFSYPILDQLFLIFEIIIVILYIIIILTNKRLWKGNSEAIIWI